MNQSEFVSTTYFWHQINGGEYYVQQWWLVKRSKHVTSFDFFIHHPLCNLRSLQSNTRIFAWGVLEVGRMLTQVKSHS